MTGFDRFDNADRRVGERTALRRQHLVAGRRFSKMPTDFLAFSSHLRSELTSLHRVEVSEITSKTLGDQSFSDSHTSIDSPSRSLIETMLTTYRRVLQRTVAASRAQAKNAGAARLRFSSQTSWVPSGEDKLQKVTMQSLIHEVAEQQRELATKVKCYFSYRIQCTSLFQFLFI